MENIGKIRRLILVRGESISEIARNLNLSRNTEILSRSTLTSDKEKLPLSAHTPPVNSTMKSPDNFR